MDKYVEKVFGELHRIPELAFEEYKTSEFIAYELKNMDFEVIKGIGGTGVLGIIEGSEPGPTLAIRADMDALPFIINGEKKVIHACGHDANSSMVLATAKNISEAGIKKGKLIFLFQPGEESGKGAKAMVDSGLLPKIDEMIGIHLRDTSELKLGEATPALRHSGVAAVDVKIIGKNCHGARPHQGINAIDVAVSAVTAINGIRVEPRIPHSAKVTNFNTAGDAFNIIPDIVNMSVDIRTQEPELLDELINKVEMAIKGAAVSYDAKYEIKIPIRLNAAIYDEDMIATAKEAIENVMGKASDELVTTGSEDFHYFTEALNINTTIIGLGADLTTGLHNPEMTFNHSALYHGVDILTEFIRLKLGFC